MREIMFSSGRKILSPDQEGNGPAPGSYLPVFYRTTEIRVGKEVNVVVRNDSLREKNPAGVTGFLKQWNGWLNRELSVVSCTEEDRVRTVTSFLQKIGLENGMDFCILR
ncbi:MAG: hypothetical protein ACOC0U_03565, partial [Desulfovibrionales bacterium]